MKLWLQSFKPHPKRSLSVKFNHLVVRLFLLFFLFISVSVFFFSARADPSYGIGNGSQYVWNVNEQIANTSVAYRLTAQFNTRHNNVSLTRYYYSNGTTTQSSLMISQFGKNIMPLNERSGINNHFYTGPGSLKFPRSVLIIEENESTQIIDQKTGITLQYTSVDLEQVLIEGNIPISWMVWVILGATIGITCVSIIFILIKGKKQYPAIIYSIQPHNP